MITLSPYDVLRIARAAGIPTGEAVRQYTIRRGSILKFRDDGTCSALEGAQCTIHQGRPLACRLYPLGMQRAPDGGESFVPLEPAAGSLGIYSVAGTVAEFLAAQNVDEHLRSVDQYGELLPLIHRRIDTLIDFDAIEPREFWRIATREALAEQNFDPNPLIDALFDADSRSPPAASITDTVTAHIDALATMIARESRPNLLAAAAAMLAASLGYPLSFASKAA